MEKMEDVKVRAEGGKKNDVAALAWDVRGGRHFQLTSALHQGVTVT